MALQLILPVTSPLLTHVAAPVLRFYVKIGALNVNTFSYVGALPLAYKALGEDGQPVGEWLTGLPLPTVAPVMNPRALMVDKTRSAFELAYQVARDYLSLVCGPDAQIADLP